MVGPWVIDPAKMSQFDGLAPEQRAVLSLVLDARKSYAEASQILGISESAVRERAHAAIDALARDPVREPPSPTPPQTPAPRHSGASLKGGLLTGLVLGSIAAAVILLTSGGKKSANGPSSAPSAAIRTFPTTVHTIARAPAVPTSSAFITGSAPRSTSPVRARPLSPPRRRPLAAIPVRRVTPAKTTTSTVKTSLAASVLRLAANSGGRLKYDTGSLEANAGAVSIDFTNRSPVPHNVTVSSSAGRVIGFTPTFQGGSRTLHLILKPGSYKFYCSVPGHRMAGMQGTLTVR